MTGRATMSISMKKQINNYFNRYAAFDEEEINEFYRHLKSKTYHDIPAGMFEKLRAFESFINESPIELHLLELIRLRVGQLNGCAYCVDMHYKELKHLGETELRLSSLSIWKEAPYFSEKERHVLAFTDKLTILNGDPVSDEVFNPLLSYFNKEEISYLTLAISHINTWNRLMKTFKFTPGNYQVNKEGTVAGIN